MSPSELSSVNKPGSASQPAQWELLEKAFRACVRAAHPASCLPTAIGIIPPGRTVVVVGAGKASAAMAQAFERSYRGDVSGIVVTRYGHSVPTQRVAVLEAAHPVPDQAGIEATRRILEALERADRQALVVGLFSGGGSALLCAPVDGLTLEDKQEANLALLNSGLPIDAMNRIRRRLSAVKGGKLTRFVQGRPFFSFLMSDVPGDDLSIIASGPSVGVRECDEDIGNIARRAGLEAFPAIMRALADPVNAPVEASSDTMCDVRNILIASPSRALAFARQVFEEAGYRVEFLGDDLEGDAASLGRSHARLALRAASGTEPVCILSGGETTVRVENTGGEGGRNTEYLLGMALELQGHPAIHAMAADTDGIDGKGEHAGAFLEPATLAYAWDSGHDAEQQLRRNNSLAVFRAAGAVFQPGPTNTNVNDFRAILIDPRR